MDTTSSTKSAQKDDDKCSAAEQLWLELMQLSHSESTAWALVDPDNPDLLRIIVECSSDDPVNDVKRNALHTYLWSVSSRSLLTRSPVTAELAPGVLCYTPSPSGRKAVVLCKDSRRGNSDQRFVDVFEESVLVSSTCVDEFHGDFHAKGWFAGVSWNSAEDAVVYVAERKVKSTAWPFRRKEPASGLTATEHDLPEFSHVEHWGEQLEQAKHPTIVHFSLTNQKVHVLKLPEQMAMSCGQPQFRPNSDELVFVAWPDDEPRKLGLVYCFQRPSSLYLIDTSKGLDVGTGNNNLIRVEDKESEEINVRSPRFSPDGNTLVFLGSPPMRTHQGASNLYVVSDVSNTQGLRSEVLFHGKQASRLEDGSSLPGIHTVDLPQSCFVHGPDKELRILLSTAWHSQQRIIAITLKTRKVQRITEFDSCSNADNAFGIQSSPACTVVTERRTNTRLLTACERTGVVVVAYSSPSDPGGVAVGVYGESCKRLADIPRAFSRRSGLSDKLAWDLLELPSVEGEYEAILVGPKSKEAVGALRGLLVMPHGGPHSAFAAQFYPSVAFYCLQLKVCCLLVNYCGSTGWPEDQLRKLPGRCGELDVSQVHDACCAVLQWMSSEMKVDCAVVGGSHGGFLAAHLVAQFPATYSAAVLRNPVIDISTMFKVTDIPDWSIIEAIGYTENDIHGTNRHYEAGDRGDSVQLRQKLYECSPIARVEAVKAPCLVHIGECDKRVPPHQGRVWVNALRAHGIRAEVQSYPKDCHPIGRPRSQAHVVLSTASFLEDVWANEDTSTSGNE